jgi:glucokinase
MKGTIGLDIGGTKILGALFDEKGAVVDRVKKKTKADEGIETVRKQILKVIDQLVEDKDLELQGIGAGAPGIVLKGQTVYFSPNIPFRDENLASLIGDHYDVPFLLGNDVNVAMYGEWKRGKFKDKRNVIGLFMGTGVGGAIIVDGELYTGAGGAGELGHMVVQPEGTLCGCGAKGCLEAYASKAGMLRAIRAELRRGRESMLKDLVDPDGAMIKSSQLEEAFREKDALAREVIERAIYYTGVATGSLVNIFHPDLLILGGGIMESLGEELLGPIVAEARRHTMPGLLDDVAVDLSHLSDDAGIIGAYELIRAHLD